jgi:TonB family protein
MKGHIYRWTLSACALFGAAAISSCTTPAEPTQKANSSAAFNPAPYWRHAPNGDDLARLYPIEAARRKISGSASIKCNVNTTGHLQDCVVLTEAPTGMNFGAATIRAAALFEMANAKGGTVKIPLFWRIR